jgi:hypothetical protein
VCWTKPRRTARPVNDAQPQTRYTWLLAWCAAFVAHRGLLAVFALDRVWYWEEAYRLLIAQSLLEGWGLSLWQLQADPYNGGSVAMGVLAMPFVALFGNSWLAAKLVAIAFATLGLVFWSLAIDRAFGRRAAHLFALAWVAAPPLFQLYNLIVMGSHAEVATLAGFVMFAWQNYLRRMGQRELLFWGIAGGVSTWFAYTAVLPFALTAVASVVFGLIAPRGVALVAIGFVAGMSPWLAFNLANEGAGLAVLGTTFTAGSDVVAPGGLEGLLRLIRFGIPPALRFESLGESAFTSRRVFADGYLILCTLGGLLCLAELRRSAARRAFAAVALAWFPAFILMIAASNQIFDERVNAFSPVDFLTYRVLVPALPGLFAAFAIGAAGVPRVFRAAVVGMLVFGMAGSIGLIVDPLERGFTRAPSSNLGAQAMGHLLVYKHGDDKAAIKNPITDQLASVPAELRQAAWHGVGYSIAWHFRPDADPSLLIERLSAVAPAYLQQAREGARTALSSPRSSPRSQIAPRPTPPRSN